MAATVWKGHISFGLVSIPVRLYSGARGKTVSFHLLHKTDNSRIREVMYCDEEHKPVVRADLVKGYEFNKMPLEELIQGDLAVATLPLPAHQVIGLVIVQRSCIDNKYPLRC